MTKLTAKEKENLLVMMTNFLDRVESETRSLINAGYGGRDLGFILSNITRSFASEKVWIKQRIFEFDEEAT